jgi:hypothetical protein
VAVHARSFDTCVCHTWEFLSSRSSGNRKILQFDIIREAEAGSRIKDLSVDVSMAYHPSKSPKAVDTSTSATSRAGGSLMIRPQVL